MFAVVLVIRCWTARLGIHRYLTNPSESRHSRDYCPALFSHKYQLFFHKQNPLSLRDLTSLNFSFLKVRCILSLLRWNKIMVPDKNCHWYKVCDWNWVMLLVRHSFVLPPVPCSNHLRLNFSTGVNNQWRECSSCTLGFGLEKRCCTSSSMQCWPAVKTGSTAHQDCRRREPKE